MLALEFAGQVGWMGRVGLLWWAFLCFAMSLHDFAICGAFMLYGRWFTLHDEWLYYGRTEGLCIQPRCSSYRTLFWKERMKNNGVDDLCGVEIMGGWE